MGRVLLWVAHMFQLATQSHFHAVPPFLVRSATIYCSLFDCSKYLLVVALCSLFPCMLATAVESWRAGFCIEIVIFVYRTYWNMTTFRKISKSPNYLSWDGAVGPQVCHAIALSYIRHRLVLTTNWFLWEFCKVKHIWEEHCPVLLAMWATNTEILRLAMKGLEVRQEIGTEWRWRYFKELFQIQKQLMQKWNSRFHFSFHLKLLKQEKLSNS